MADDKEAVKYQKEKTSSKKQTLIKVGVGFIFIATGFYLAVQVGIAPITVVIMAIEGIGGAFIINAIFGK